MNAYKKISENFNFPLSILPKRTDPKPLRCLLFPSFSLPAHFNPSRLSLYNFEIKSLSTALLLSLARSSTQIHLNWALSWSNSDWSWENFWCKYGSSIHFVSTKNPNTSQSIRFFTAHFEPLQWSNYTYKGFYILVARSMKWGIKAKSGLRRSASGGSAHYDERSGGKRLLWSLMMSMT
jgi:hypothetical protein